MNNKPVISIIIPTVNSEKHILSCLQSIAQQKYKNYEVVVVDQQSTDATVAIAKKFRAKLVSVPRPKFYSPPSASRNIGAKIAKGDIFYHLDSDMQISPELLNEVVILFQKHKDVGALIVHEEDMTKGFFSKCKALERKCYRGNDNIDSARIVRKEIFQKVKGYDEKISSGEDFDIHTRYKKYCKIAYCKNTVRHDLTQLNFLKMLKKKYNYGKTAHLYFQKTNSSGIDILKEELHAYIRSYQLLFSHPILTIGMVFMKACEIAAGGFGYVQGRMK